jgi:hypothetical protein
LVPIDKWLKPVTFITRLLQKQNAPDRDETCLTDRSRLMIVYRLITNYSRRGRHRPKISLIGRNELS